MATKIKYSMTRGDSRSLAFALPTSVYTPNSKVFFAMKTQPDNDSDDSTAVVKKELTDADIDSQDANVVNYTLVLEPNDTTNVEPGTYQAEFEYVSQDGLTVITYPDRSKQTWEFTLSPDINRRTT